MSRLLIPSLLVFVFAASTQAEVIIDFQSLETTNADFNLQGNSYVEDGFIVSESGGSGQLGSVGTLESRFSGSTALTGTAANSLISLTRVGGGLFELNSIDLAEFSTIEGTPSVTFTGILGGGGVTSQTFTLDGSAFAAESFAFDSTFESLVAVVWVQSSPVHQFDNINITVAAIPEPGTFGVIALLGFVGTLIRRRR